LAALSCCGRPLSCGERLEKSQLINIESVLDQGLIRFKCNVIVVFFYKARIKNDEDMKQISEAKEKPFTLSFEILYLSRSLFGKGQGAGRVILSRSHQPCFPADPLIFNLTLFYIPGG
jgi:hypothetical protein